MQCVRSLSLVSIPAKEETPPPIPVVEEPKIVMLEKGSAGFRSDPAWKYNPPPENPAELFKKVVSAIATLA